MAKTYRHIPRQNREKFFGYKRGKKLTRHHLLPKSRGGNGEPENILYLWVERHRLWHFLFGNNSLEEIIQILQRIARMKGREYEKTS